MSPEEFASLPSLLNVGDGRTDVARAGKAGSVIGENSVDPIRDDLDEFAQEVDRSTAGDAFHQAVKGEIGSAIHRGKEGKLALCSAHFGQIDVEVANGVFLNFFFLAGRPLSRSGIRLMPWR